MERPPDRSAAGLAGHSLELARAVLWDRPTRRRWLARALGLALAMMALGLWAIDGWLEEGLLRFLLWWAGCAAVTCFVVLLALYDALRVVREERERAFGRDDERPR